MHSFQEIPNISPSKNINRRHPENVSSRNASKNETHLVSHQYVHLFTRQQVLRIKFVDDAVRYSLFVDLAIVDVLLHRVVCHQTIHVAAFRLSVSVDATDGLAVMTWVPRRVKDDDTTRTNQVYAETPGSVGKDLRQFTQCLGTKTKR